MIVQEILDEKVVLMVAKESSSLSRFGGRTEDFV